MRIVLIGNLELRTALRPMAEVRRAADIDAACRLAEQDWFPDVGVVEQNWPDQHSAESIDRLLRNFPLTRWICCYDPWCDSDGRSRSLWPLALRVPRSQLEDRLARESAAITGSGPVLPLTAGRDEAFEFEYGQRWPAAAKQIPVSVVSPDRGLRETLCAVLQACGFRVDTRHAPLAAVIVWDADPWNSSTENQLFELRRESPACRIVALIGFERADLAHSIIAAGADQVVWKLAAARALRQAITADGTRAE